MEYYTGKDYGPKDGMAYTQVMPKEGFKYMYGQDGTRYSVPEDPVSGDPGINPISKIPTDQEIRDKGFKFIPDQKYLKSPFTFPVDKEPVVDKGIVATDSFNDNEPFYSTTTNMSLANTGGVQGIGASPLTNRVFNNQMFETGPYADPYAQTDYNKFPMADPLNQKIADKLREDGKMDAKYTDEELIDMYGNQNFKGGRFEDEEEEFNFMDYLPFVGDKSIFQGIIGALPKQDSRFTNIRSYYGGRDNLDSIGRIKSGLMAGYSPVSGGFLNTITGGRYGSPTRYGLQRAYQKRLDTLAKTEKRQGGLSPELLKRRADLQAAKAEELQSIQQGQREKDYNTIQDAYQNQTGAGSSYSGGENTRSARTTGNYDDPFAPGDAD
tara:strand:- start:177 stop:1319 length:1143 start_codon:yes stop_codon:yes gene_type:complete